MLCFETFFSTPPYFSFLPSSLPHFSFLWPPSFFLKLLLLKVELAISDALPFCIIKTQKFSIQRSFYQWSGERVAGGEGWWREEENRERMGKYQSFLSGVKGKEKHIIIKPDQKKNTQIQRCIYNNHFLLGIKIYLAWCCFSLRSGGKKKEIKILVHTYGLHFL